MPQYISDNTDDEMSHAVFLDAYLQSRRAEPVDLNRLRTLPSSKATGAKQVGRLIKLQKLDVDTSWYTRYRSEQNPDFWAQFPQAVTIRHEPAIALNDSDTPPTQEQPVPTTTAQQRHLVVRVFAGLLATAEDDDARLLALDDAERSLRPREVCGPARWGCGSTARRPARAGELGRAQRCLAEADVLAGMWQGGTWRAAAWEARAALRVVEGDRERGAALLREAAALFAVCGRAVDQALCEREAAAAERASRRRHVGL
jgi:hypothetical protein